jgi:hypothetical protein
MSNAERVCRQASDSRSPAISPYKCLCCYIYGRGPCRHKIMAMEDEEKANTKLGRRLGDTMVRPPIPMRAKKDAESFESPTRMFNEMVESRGVARKPREGQFVNGMADRLVAGVYYLFGITVSPKSGAGRDR